MYSKDSYRALLSLALAKGYRFISFEDERPADAARIIYLRHDVDLLPRFAQEMAAINHSLGIRATFFVQLRSMAYNLRDPEVMQNVRAILDLNQYVGLHFPSPEVIPDDPMVLTEMIQSDFEILTREVPEVRPVFSWHNTTPQIIDWGLQHAVPGLINAYSPSFFKEIAYRSDSLARYTIPELEAIINENHPVMQLLFHPEIWIGGGANLAEISAGIWRQIIRNYDFDLARYALSAAKPLPHHVPDDVLDAFVAQLITHGEQS